MIRNGQRAAVAALAVAVAFLGFGVLRAPANEHRVQLELIDDSTSWPWHSSIQRASAVWINSADGQQWAGTATVQALRPKNIVDLVIVATSASADESAAAAEDTAQAFISHDEAIRAEPVELRIEALSAELAVLRDEFSEQERAVGEAANDAEIVIRSTRLEGTAALIGELEGKRAEAEEELAAQAIRYQLVESEAVQPLQARLPETLKLFAGLGFLLFVALTLYERSTAADGRH